MQPIDGQLSLLTNNVKTQHNNASEFYQNRIAEFG